jgi:predicted GIY-YIG superfamily endonuclease
MFEEFSNRSEALKREKQIKNWKGGEAFKKLIAGQ